VDVFEVRQRARRRPLDWVRWNLRRARVKSPRQLLRAILLRLWPLSIFVRLFYRMRFGPTWLGFVNGRARAAFEREAAELDGPQRRAVEALRSAGLHAARLEDLLPAEDAFDDIQTAARRLLDRPEIRRQIREGENKNWGIPFVVPVFGLHPTRAVPRPLAELVLNERILGIVNSYLGLWSRLLYLDVWYSIPDCPSGPSNTEAWHRDHEDRHTIKLFLYLHDIEPEMGPFCFIEESQPGGRLGDLFPARPPDGRIPREGALLGRVSESQIRTCTGKAGTVLLADTCGLHKASRPKGKPRIVIVATYASDGAIDPRRYRLAEPEQYQSLCSASKYALGGSAEGSA